MIESKKEQGEGRTLVGKRNREIFLGIAVYELVKNYNFGTCYQK